MIGDAPAWPTVDPYRLRTVADVQTWEELDYWIAARTAMTLLWVRFRAGDAWRAIGVAS